MKDMKVGEILKCTQILRFQKKRRAHILGFPPSLITFWNFGVQKDLCLKVLE